MMKKPRKSRIVVLVLLVMVPTFILVVLLPLLIHVNSQSGQQTSGVPRAAIIDQLSISHPNPALIELLKDQLQHSGFEVMIFNGEEITVDLYRRLPEYGFHFILFRAHSDLSDDIDKTVIYTNEPYHTYKYPYCQFNDMVACARTVENAAAHFSVSSNFISAFNPDSFQRCLVMVMGCASLREPDMAQAFVDKGALAYVGWHASVSLNHLDETTLVMVDKLCGEGLSVADSVKETIEEKGVDSDYKAFPLYYSISGGYYRLQEIVNHKAL